MHLVGQLSNLSGPLKAVFEAVSSAPLPATWCPAPQHETDRLGNGIVQRAILEVLATAGRPLRGTDIHAAVAHLLGHQVSKNSVSWSLAAGARASTRLASSAPLWAGIDFRIPVPEESSRRRQTLG